MKLIDLLQGKGLGHPLHPAIVHIPVGAWVAACFLDIAAVVSEGIPPLGVLATYSVALGLVAALLAIPTGVAEWSGIKREKPAWRLGLYHLALNLAATIIWCLNLGLRWAAAQEREGLTRPVLYTSVAGACLVLVGGYLGGRMVFDQGTSIARQSKKKWRALAVRAGSRVPDEK